MQSVYECIAGWVLKNTWVNCFLLFCKSHCTLKRSLNENYCSFWTSDLTSTYASIFTAGDVSELLTKQLSFYWSMNSISSCNQFTSVYIIFSLQTNSNSIITCNKSAIMNMSHELQSVYTHTSCSVCKLTAIQWKYYMFTTCIKMHFDFMTNCRLCNGTNKLHLQSHICLKIKL